MKHLLAAEILISKAYVYDILTAVSDLESGKNPQRQLVSYEKMVACISINGQLIICHQSRFSTQSETKAPEHLMEPQTDSFSFKIIIKNQNTLQFTKKAAFLQLLKYLIFFHYTGAIIKAHFAVAKQTFW